MADKFIKIPGKNNKTFSISGTLEDMDAYENLTDSIVDQIMWSTDKNLEEAKKILINVKKRKLYVCLGHALLPQKMTSKEAMKKYVKNLKENGSTLCESDVTIDVVKLNYGMKDKNPIDEVRFYKKDNPDEATKIYKREVSFLLPDTFEEHQIRFYCKTTEAEKLQKAREALDDWCKEQKCSLIKGS